MTGQYPARTPVGLKEPLTPVPKDSTVGLTMEYTSIATLIKSAGYHTALSVKWHLGFLPEYSPGKNGFDYFFGIHSGAPILYLIKEMAEDTIFTKMKSKFTQRGT